VQARINVGLEQDDHVELATLRLNNKGVLAAEGYLLARYHLYSQVYLHKTTRAAERMLAALLTTVIRLVRNGSIGVTGMTESDPLLVFFRDDKADVRRYLQLDDSLIWSAIAQMSSAKDDHIREMAIRLRDRQLYKCIDVGERALHLGGDSLAHFKRRLKEDFGNLLDSTVLRDEVNLTAYGWHDYEESGALQKVLVADATGRSRDIVELSPTVKAIQPHKVFRIYCGSTRERQAIEKLREEVIR
jgi:HD superfamily phosphohydrolase